jgi:hypothetical protein
MFEACCYADEGEPPSFEADKLWRKARKVHRCCECHRDSIKPGDLYLIEAGIWDGEWETFKTCRVCYGVRSDFFKGGFVYGRMWENLYGCYATGDKEDDAWLEPPGGWR